MDNQMKLTVKDCEIIVDALEAWIHSDLNGAIMSSILAGMIRHGSDDPEAKKAAEEITKDGKKSYEEGKRKKTEIARLLQAKIILLKDTLQVENLTNG